MLFIFRKLRRSFFLPGKGRTYLAYAVGEIALIVIGILIAVQIGEWNEERKLRIEEIEFLKKLESELKIQIEESHKIYSYNTEFANLGVRFMEAHLNQQDVTFDMEDYVRLGDYYPVNIQINSLEVAVQGDKNSLIESDALVDSLRQLKATLNHLVVDSQYIDELWQNHLVPFHIESGLAVQRYQYHHSDKVDLDPTLLATIDNEDLANRGAYLFGLIYTGTNNLKTAIEAMQTSLRMVQEELEERGN